MNAVNKKDPEQKNLVLYKGTDIVAAAQLEIKKPVAFLSFLNTIDDGMKVIFSYFLAKIERWIVSKFDIDIINTFCTDAQIDL